MSDTDRIEIGFSSDVPESMRLSLLAEIAHSTRERGYYVYDMPRFASNERRIEITNHDRTTFDLTDGQVVERLRETARAQGMSVKELLRKLAVLPDNASVFDEVIE